METRIELEGGKYTYVCDNMGNQEALRHGEKWRDLVGDKFVYCLAYRITELQEQNKALVEALKAMLDASAIECAFDEDVGAKACDMAQKALEGFK